MIIAKKNTGYDRNTTTQSERTLSLETVVHGRSVAGSGGGLYRPGRLLRRLGIGKNHRRIGTATHAPFTMELVNLAVEESCQGRGVGKRLIRHAVETARNAGCTVLEVGTGNPNRATGPLPTLRILDRFDRQRFFSRHYREKIIENGIECRHMIRLKMELGEERIPLTAGRQD